MVRVRMLIGYSSAGGDRRSAEGGRRSFACSRTRSKGDAAFLCLIYGGSAKCLKDRVAFHAGIGYAIIVLN